MIQTALTCRLSLKTPIVQGPMAGASGGALVGAVARAGGLGFIGAGYMNVPQLVSNIDMARAAVDAPAPRACVPIGIGFLLWKLTALHGGTPGTQTTTEATAMIDAALKSRPKALWIAYGTRDDAALWSAYIRARDAELGLCNEALHIFFTANNIEEARFAIQECHADAIAAQGHEAGGHGSSSAPSRDVLLARILTELPRWNAPQPVSVLSAGGIADGASTAAQLVLGADGVVVGTRFLLTPEALYSDAQKQLLAKADGADTVRSYAFDDARNTIGWPPGVDGRGLRSVTVDEFEAVARHADSAAHVPGAAERQARYRMAKERGETHRLVTWAGTGVGLVNSIMPARDVMEELDMQAHVALKRAYALLRG